MSKVDSDFGEIYVCKYCGEDVGKFNEETGDHPQCEELAEKNAELSALRERVEALEAALKPFAEIPCLENFDDNQLFDPAGAVIAGDIRKARAALQAPEWGRNEAAPE